MLEMSEGKNNCNYFSADQTEVEIIHEVEILKAYLLNLELTGTFKCSPSPEDIDHLQMQNNERVVRKGVVFCDATKKNYY